MIDKHKKYYLVLDVESANTLEQPLVYDIGYQVVDKKGRVYEEKSHAITDLFWKSLETLDARIEPIAITKTKDTQGRALVIISGIRQQIGEFY